MHTEKPITLSRLIFTKQLLNPRFFLTGLGMLVMYGFSWLPMVLLRPIGKGIGKLAFKLAKHRREITLKNLELCFPDLSQEERYALAKKNFETAGVSLFEMAYAWLASDKRVEKLIRYEGLEYLEQAKAIANKKGKGILLLTAHSYCLELGARGIALKTAFHPMYRPHKNRYFDQWQAFLRKKHSQLKPVERGNLRQVLKVLKQGKMLWYAPDQNYGGTEHVFAPFFGIPALTITATSKIAKITGAQVLPYYVFKQEDGKYLVKIFPTLQDFPTDDVYLDCVRINTLFEQWIDEAKDQYLWSHRRFKTRPEGEKSLY